jgi:glyoxylase-like metal-dependent hydrolase (beta-lactamase superfamily II)
MAEPWREVGDRVYVRRHRSYDLNVGLVVGDGACLVIDTRLSHRQARELTDAIRRVTPYPWSVVNTHAHFDHYFGNAVFAPAPMWGHQRCAEIIRQYGEVQRDAMIAHARGSKHDDLVADLSEVRIHPPDRLFASSATLAVGGREVRLVHPGRGHTDNDIVVDVVDAGVLFAGDLVEQGAPPAFEDAFPLDWPATMDTVLTLVRGPVVPGHGDVVDRSFVDGQRAELTAMAELSRRAYAEGRAEDDAAAEAPFPADAARDALRRAFRQLRGDPPYDPPDQVRASLGL